MELIDANNLKSEDEKRIVDVIKNSIDKFNLEQSKATLKEILDKQIYIDTRPDNTTINAYDAIETVLQALEDKNKKINKTLEIAYQYAQIDGDHHKMWVVDQMIRNLLGSYYDNWVKKYEEDDYTWETGIAP